MHHVILISSPLAVDGNALNSIGAGKTTLRNSIAKTLQTLLNDKNSPKIQLHGRDTFKIYKDNGLPGKAQSKDIDDGSDAQRDEMYKGILESILTNSSEDIIALVCGNWDPRLKSPAIQKFFKTNAHKFSCVLINVECSNKYSLFDRMEGRALKDQNAAARNKTLLDDKESYLKQCAPPAAHQHLSKSTTMVGDLEIPTIFISNNENLPITKIAWHKDDTDEEQMEIFANTPTASNMILTTCDFILQERTKSLLRAPIKGRKRSNSEINEEGINNTPTNNTLKRNRVDNEDEEEMISSLSSRTPLSTESDKIRPSSAPPGCVSSSDMRNHSQLMAPRILQLMDVEKKGPAKQRNRATSLDIKGSTPKNDIEDDLSGDEFVTPPFGSTATSKFKPFNEGAGDSTQISPKKSQVLAINEEEEEVQYSPTNVAAKLERAFEMYGDEEKAGFNVKSPPSRSSSSLIFSSLVDQGRSPKHRSAQSPFLGDPSHSPKILNFITGCNDSEESLLHETIEGSSESPVEYQGEDTEGDIINRQSPRETPVI